MPERGDGTRSRGNEEKPPRSKQGGGGDFKCERMRESLAHACPRSKQINHVQSRGGLCRKQLIRRRSMFSEQALCVRTKSSENERKQRIFGPRAILTLNKGRSTRSVEHKFMGQSSDLTSRQDPNKTLRKNTQVRGTS